MGLSMVGKATGSEALRMELVGVRVWKTSSWRLKSSESVSLGGAVKMTFSVFASVHGIQANKGRRQAATSFILGV